MLAMKTRLFCGQSVPEVGLGCWQLGGDWGEVGDDQARQILQTAYDQGCRLFDTAEGYGGGRSESRLGAFMAALPPGADRPVIATKISRDKMTPDSATPGLRQATEGSLKRLGLDQIDLTQLHCVPTPSLVSEAVWTELRKLRDEGLVAHIGASVETVEQGKPHAAGRRVASDYFQYVSPKARNRGAA